MSNIPTKGDQQKDKAAQAEAARKASIPGQVKSFTDDIVAAMGRGDNYLPVQTRMPEPEAQQQIKDDFRAKGWIVDFRPARTGGSITWR